MDEQSQTEFRSCMRRFVSGYRYLTRIAASSVKLERDYLYGSALLLFIKAEGAGRLDLTGQLIVTNVSVLLEDEGGIELPFGQGVVPQPTLGGLVLGETEKVPLSEILATINAAHGSTVTTDEYLFFLELVEELASKPAIQAAAAVNSLGNFTLPMIDTSQVPSFAATIVAKFSDHLAIVGRYLNEDTFKAHVHAIFIPMLQQAAIEASG